MRSAPRIVISGYYGFHNAGDEAVLAGLVDTFRDCLPEAQLHVASADPEATRALHGVEAFDRYRWQEFREQMRACDAFVSGGGSLLQDVTSRRSIYYYLGTLALASYFRRPVMICGQGIGPIQAAPARSLATMLLNRARVITVRDPDSLETLKALGVHQPTVELTADPVFALRPADPEPAALLLRREGVDLSRPRVAFALRAWPPAPEGGDRPAEGEALENAAAEAVAYVARELNAQPVLVPMHPPGDQAFARAVADRAGVPCVRLCGGYPPRDTVALFGQMDLVVGMRLHALIFAALQGVPLVGISYDPKVEGFLRSLERTSAADLASIRGETLSQAIRHVWENRQEESTALRRHAAQLRNAALQNGALLTSLVSA